MPGHRSSVTSTDRIVFGLRLEPLTHDQVIERCRVALADRSRMLIGVVNASKVVHLRRDPLLRESLLECDIIVADGQSVVWASRLVHQPLPERVAGCDLFESLLAVAHRDGRSVYLLGARPEVLRLLEARIEERFPGLRIAGSRDGYFKDGESEQVAAEIRESNADMLFLGITSPKKEIFLGTYGDSLGVPIMHGVGGSFDVLAGITKRAPERWQRMGLEWAYRTLQEPRRMWKRYLTTNTEFMILLGREMVHPTPMLVARAQHGSREYSGSTSAARSSSIPPQRTSPDAVESVAASEIPIPNQRLTAS